MTAADGHRAAARRARPARPRRPGRAVPAARARDPVAARLLRPPGDPDVPDSVSTGSLDDGLQADLSRARLRRRRSTKFGKQFVNSLLYGGIATILTFLIGFPVAYTIAFRGGRYKNLLLFLVIAPFFTSFLIRTISWKILLGDDGPVLGPLKDARHPARRTFSLLGTPDRRSSPASPTTSCRS